MSRDDVPRPDLGLTRRAALIVTAVGSLAAALWRRTAGKPMAAENRPGQLPRWIGHRTRD